MLSSWKSKWHRFQAMGSSSCILTSLIRSSNHFWWTISVPYQNCVLVLGSSHFSFLCFYQDLHLSNLQHNIQTLSLFSQLAVAILADLHCDVHLTPLCALHYKPSTKTNIDKLRLLRERERFDRTFEFLTDTQILPGTVDGEGETAWVPGRWWWWWCLGEALPLGLPAGPES